MIDIIIRIAVAAILLCVAIAAIILTTAIVCAVVRDAAERERKEAERHGKADPEE